VDLNAVNSKGYVPALVLDNGELLTENVALLPYIADLKPAAQLLPPNGTLERYRTMEWLAWANSELHKSFSPLFYPDSSDEVKQKARDKITKWLGWLSQQLGSRQYLVGDHFTVADAYVFVVMSWTAHVHVDLAQWPNLKAFQERIAARPHVIEAMTSEGLLKK